MVFSTLYFSFISTKIPVGFFFFFLPFSFGWKEVALFLLRSCMPSVSCYVLFPFLQSTYLTKLIYFPFISTNIFLFTPLFSKSNTSQIGKLLDSVLFGVSQKYTFQIPCVFCLSAVVLSSIYRISLESKLSVLLFSVFPSLALLKICSF